MREFFLFFYGTGFSEFSESFCEVSCLSRVDCCSSSEAGGVGHVSGLVFSVTLSNNCVPAQCKSNKKYYSVDTFSENSGQSAQKLFVQETPGYSVQ